MPPRHPPIPRTPERMAVVGRCVAFADRAVAALEASAADEVGVLRAHVGLLREWHLNHVTDAVLREGVREMGRTRDVMKRAVEGHEAGIARIDASVRTTVAFMCWRTGAYATGSQDDTVEVWCRMGLAETLARYAESDVGASAAPDGAEVAVYPVPLTPPVVHALYARSPERMLRQLLGHMRAECGSDLGARGAEILALHWPRSAEPMAESIAAQASSSRDDSARFVLHAVRFCCETVGAPTQADAVAALRAALEAARASDDAWFSKKAAEALDALNGAVDKAREEAERCAKGDE